MTNSEKYNELREKINDLHYYTLLQKLDDLSELWVDDVDIDSSEVLTELEKSLVCISLYWFYQGVLEDGNKGCGSGKNKNISEDKIVPTLSNNLSKSKVSGGEIGAFFETCFDWNVFGKGKGINSGNIIARNSSQGPSCNEGFVAWCAIFMGHCWIEALTSLGFTDSVKSDKFYNVIEKSYGKVKIDFSDNSYMQGDDNSFIGRLIQYAEAEVLDVPSVGNMFFVQRGDKDKSGNTAGHCGIVVKVDEANKEYYTIEGNRKREDGTDGIVAKKYSFSEQIKADNGKYYSVRFLSLRKAGEYIKNNPKKYIMDGKEYYFDYTFTSYLEHSCWSPSLPSEIDIPVVPSDVPPFIPPVDLPSGIECPSGKHMYGYSPVRENDARDTDAIAKLNIARLEKEYWENYGLDLQFSYDIESDLYYACGDAYIPKSDSCSPGEVKDKDGNCKSNVPNVKCCDISIKYPGNPMEMLPITSLRKANNEVGKLNEDILIDIITEKKLSGFSAIRVKSTHGQAMGLLNPNTDTGQSTGFGMFRGMGSIGSYLNDSGMPPIPVYMVGYKGSYNFASAILKGLAGAVDTRTLTNLDLTPNRIAEIIEHDEANGNFMNWLYKQEQSGAFELIELRAEAVDENPMWEQFTENGYPRGKKQKTSPTDHLAEVWVVHNGNRKSRLSTKLWAEAKKSSNPLTTGQYIHWFEEQFWSWKKHKWDGISGSFDELLEVIDNISRREGSPNKVTLIVLEKARLTRRPIWNDILVAIQVLAQVGGSLVGMGDVAGGLVKQVGQYLTALGPAFKAADSFKKVIKKEAGSNWISGLSNGFIEMTKAATLLAPDTIKGIWDGRQDNFLHSIYTDAREYINKFAGAIGWTDDKNNLYNVIGTRLGEVSNYLGLTKTALNEANLFFTKKIGLNYNELTDEYKKLTTSIDKNINLISELSKHPNENSDLNDGLAYLENVKNMFFSAAVADFFNPQNKDIWQYTLNLQAVGGDFLYNNLIRSAFMKSANGGLPSSIPGLDTIMGAALGVNASMGGGHEMVLNKYGADTLFSMIKTAYGIPTSAGELKDLIKDSFALEFNVGEYGSRFKEQNDVIIPSYIDDEIRECIVCDFEKSNIPMKVCQDGMQYNYLTGKCDYMTFNGFEPPACYNVCDKIITPTSIPDEIKVCDGSYYYDISDCPNSGNILTNDAITNAIESGASAFVSGLMSAFLSDRTILNDAKSICKCFEKDTTDLEKQIICEASLHLNKKGYCSDYSFLNQMHDAIKSVQSQDGVSQTDWKELCSWSWCALFVAYVLLNGYKKASINSSVLIQAFKSYGWAVRYLVRDLLKNNVGKQSLTPRPGAISFSKSYVSNSNDHIGIVACVDAENKKFYTIEGNVLDAENTPSVRFVEYSFSEIASDLIDTSKTDFSTSNTANFGKQIRFIHLTEKGGTYNEDCKCNDAPKDTPVDIPKDVPTENEIPKCIVRKDCIENDKRRRYAVFTDDGWYVYSGEKGFSKYKANTWLKFVSGCDFIEVKCGNKDCDCPGGGCDCETLQDKLDVLKTDIEKSADAKYRDIIAKIEAIPQTPDNKDLLVLIKDLINDVKKGILVVLNDGDDNTIIDNKTTEILLLLAELRGLLQEMKYCEVDELTAEIQELVVSVTEELHKRRDTDIKKSYPELENYLSDIQRSTDWHSASETYKDNIMHSALYIDEKLNDDLVVVEEDWYDATIDRLIGAIDMARNSLDNCSCEDINMPSGSSVINNYYGNDDETSSDATEKLIEKINENIKEIIKEQPVEVRCEGANCDETDKKIEELKNKIDDILEVGVPTKDADTHNKIDDLLNKIDEIKNGGVVVNTEQLKEIIRQTPVEVRCEGANCGDVDIKIEELKNKIDEIKNSGVVVNTEQLKEVIRQTPVEVRCEGANCGDVDIKIEELKNKIDEILEAGVPTKDADTKRKIDALLNKIDEIKNGGITINTDAVAPVVDKITEKITERIPEIITNESVAGDITNNIVEKIIQRLPEINLKCQGANCPDYTAETLEPIVQKIIEKLKHEIPEIITPKVDIDNEKLEIIIQKIIKHIPSIPATINTDGLKKIKEIIKDISIKCEGANCDETDKKIDELKDLIVKIKTDGIAINSDNSINEKINDLKNFIANIKVKIDDKSVMPIIEKELEKVIKSFNNTIDNTIREFFYRNTEIFNSNFEKVISKSISEQIDSSVIISAIERLKSDFAMLINEAKEIAPTENNNAELKEWFNKIVEKIDTVRVPSDKITDNNKVFLLELKKLKDDIVYEINTTLDKKSNYNNEATNKYYEVKESNYNNEASNKYRDRPHSYNVCPKCNLDYGNCNCPKLVEEKIDRKILFDYARNDERSPFHETFDMSNNYNPNIMNQLERGGY